MLNREHFVLIAGNPKKWDDETIRRTQGRDGEGLPVVQEDQFDRGRRSAKLTRLITGWAVTNNSGLGGDPVLFRGGKTREEAVKWGREWADKDPTNREFIASKTDMAGRT